MASSQQAVRAAAFTNSIGVELHLDHPSTPYTNIATDEAALAYLNPNGIGTGVATIRDESLAYGSGLTTLANLGYQLDIYMWYASGNVSGSQQNSWLQTIYNTGKLRMIEGPLEVDNSGWGMVSHGTTYTSPSGGTYSGWQGAVAWQRDLWNTWSGKTQVALFSLAVPANGAANSQAVAAANQLGVSLTSITGYGNVHYYQANGYSPGTLNAGALLSWAINSETGYTPGKPFVITEAGFTSVPGQGYQGNPYVDGVYTLDLVLDAYKAGSALTDIYELFDESNIYPGSDQGGFGMFDANGNPKPAATDMRNLMAVLGDTGSTAKTFTAGTLAYSVSGLASPGQSLLLQKSNGNFELVVWSDASIFVGGRQTTAPTQNVTVSLGGTYSTVNIYDPTKGATAVQTLSNVSSVSLAITDHPLVIEVPSAGGGGGSGGGGGGGSGGGGSGGGGGGASPITVGTGHDSAVVVLNEDAYQGDAQFTVTVDGIQVGGTQTATALHSSSQTQSFTFKGNWGTGQHSVAVKFLNDAYGGTATTDRNLYVTSVSYNGVAAANGSASMLSAGTVTFTAGTAANPRVVTVADGQSATTQAGYTDIVNITGSATVTTNGNDTVNAGDGTDTVKVNAGNVVVNGGAGTLSFTENGAGTVRLNLKSGTTTAKLGSGGGTIYVEGNVTATGGAGTDTYVFTKDSVIDTAVINSFVVGKDHLHQSGYGTTLTAGVQSSGNNATGGFNIKLTDGGSITLAGVQNVTLSQLFA